MADGNIEIGIELDSSKAKSQATKTGNEIASGIDSGLKSASKSADTAANEIDKSFKNAGKSAKSSLSGVGDSAKSSFGDVGDAARNSFNDVSDAAKSASSDASSAFESVPADAKGSFNDTASEARSSLGDVGSAAKSASSDAATAFEGIPADAAGSFNDTASAAQSGFSGVVEAAKGAAGQVKEAFSGLGETIRGSGDDSLNVFGVQIPVKAAAATAAVTALGHEVYEFGKESVTTGMDFDKAMSQVAATMGVTTEEVQELNEFAQKMGATTSFSATQSAQALNYMALAGYNAETAMSMLPTVLNLAAAGNMELATASDMVTDAQSALGLTIDETREMVDKMAKASSKSNTSVEQLGNAFLTVGGTAKTLKGGTTELATSLGILADNGIKGSEGGTALRNIILSLSAPTDKAAEALKQLGVEAFDSQGNLRSLDDIFNDLNGALSSMTQGEQTQVLNEIFNKVDLKSVNALLANTTGNLAAVKESLEATGLSFDGLGFSAANGEDVIYEFGKVVTQTLQESNGNIDEAVAKLQDDFILSYDEAKTMVEATSGAIANSTSRFQELTAAIDDSAGSAEQMADTQLDNLAGDLTLLESATEGFQISISNGMAPALRLVAQVAGESFSSMKEAWDESIANGDFTSAGQVVIQGIANIINEVVGKIPDFINAAVELIGGLVIGFAQALPGMITSLVGMLAQMIPSLIEAAINIVVALVDALPQIIQAIIDALPEIIVAIVDALIACIPQLIMGFIRLFMAFVQALPQIIVQIVTAIPQIVNSLASKMAEAAPQLFQKAVEFFSGLPQAVAEMAPQLLSDFVSFLGDIITNIIKWAVDMYRNAQKAGRDFLNGVVTFIQQLPGKIVTFIRNIISNITSFATNMANKARELGSNFLNNIINFIQQLPGKIAGFVSSIITNITKFVTDMGAKATSAGKSFLNNVVSFITQLPGKVGSFLTNAISKVASFATSMGSKALEAGRNFLNNIVNTISSIPGKMLTIGKNIVQGLWNGINNVKDWILDKISGFVDGIIGGIKDFFGIKSPSRVMRDEVGKMLGKGIAIGFELSDPLDQIEATLQSGMMGLQLSAMTAGQSVGDSYTTNQQTIHFNQPVQSPDVIARTMRMQARYGLAGRY